MRLIDANDLKKCKFKEPMCDYRIGWNDAIDAVADNAPTIEAESVRHGRWVKRGNKWQCTHCKILMNIDGTPEENLLYYCPHCGAKMDLKEGVESG